MAPHVGLSLLTLFPKRVGGSETYVRALLDEFSRSNGEGPITVLANRHVMRAYRDVIREPLRLHHVRSYRPGNRDMTRAAAVAFAGPTSRRVARDVPPEIDVLHFPLTLTIPRSHLPTVVTLHDLAHHEFPKHFPPLVRRYRRWAYDGAARRADLVAAVSEHTRLSAIERLGLDPERVVAIPHGIDTERFTETPSEHDDQLLAKLGLPERFVLYPANLWPHKNHARLIHALAARTDRDLCLVLTGETYGRLHALLARARRLRVGGQIRHLGFVDRETMPVLYRRATATVFPSLAEGFGAPPLEAMACGCPVAASTRGSLAEVCGGAALPFDPDDTESIADAVTTITENQAVRSRLSRAGTQRAAGYSWEVAAKRHRELYSRAAVVGRATARAFGAKPTRTIPMSLLPWLVHVTHYVNLAGMA